MSILKKCMSITTLLILGFLLVGCDKATNNEYLDKIESITIHFDTDGGTTMSSITINQALIDSIDVEKMADVELGDLDFLTPVKTGFLFDSWYLDDSLTEELTKDSPILEEYLKLFEEEDSITLDITLYVKWSEVPLDDISSTITYHLDGGMNHTDNPVTFTSDDTFTLLDPTKEGYTFEGWFIDDGFTTEISVILTGSEEDIDLWAKWSPVTVSVDYTITYNLDGGINDLENVSTFTSTDTNITLLSPSKADFSFDGWYLDEDFVNSISVILGGTDNNIEVWAKWSPVTVNHSYTVTYQLDGGTNNSSNPTLFVEDTVTILQDPVKEGYLFMGWYTDSSLTSPITSLNSIITKDITIYAKWQDNTAPDYLTYEVFDDHVVITGVTDDRAFIEIPDTYMGLPVTTIGKNAFYWNRNITTVVLPETITTIEEGAFSVSSLANINFPESLKTIGDSAFYGCAFTELVLPETIEFYGIDVFRDNSELTTVTLPENMVIIREGFFENCDALQSINIPISVEEIEDNAFAGCLALANVDLTNVRFIGHGAFANCQSFTRIELSNKLTVINDSTFAYTSKVTEVILPEHLEIIADSAFSGSYSLEHIDFPNTLEFIGEGAFWGCSLKTLIIPNSLLVIGEHAFRYNDFTVVYLPGTLEIVDSLAFRDCENLYTIFISGKIDKMGERVFRDTRYSGTIYVDGSENNNGWAAEWRDNYSGTIKYDQVLSSLTISYVLNGGINHEDNISLLGINYNQVLKDATKEGYHFMGWFTDVELTEEISVIPQGSSYDVTLYAKWEEVASNEHTIIYHLDGGLNLDNAPSYYEEGSVTLLMEPTKVGSIFRGWYNDSNFTNKVNIITSDKNTDVSLYALWEEDYILYEEFDDYVVVTGLKYQLPYVEIPSTYNGKPVTTIGESSFANATVVLELILPDSITTIEEHAISILHLRQLDLNEGLLTIGDFGIEGSDDLEEIIVPSTVTSLGKGAFYSNRGLKTIVFNNSMTTITESMFEDCFSLETIVIPEGVTRIEKYAFDDCELLSNVTLPSTLTYIGGYAFARTTVLKELILPEGLLEIGDGGFYESGIETLIIPDTVTTLGEDLIKYAGDLETLTIGASVTTVLSYEDFRGLVSLKNIFVSANNELYDSFDGVLYANYDQYTLLKFPENSSHIDHQIVDGTLAIERAAFQDSTITTVSFPDSLITINSYAFYNCDNLTSIYLPATITSIIDSIFTSNKHMNIYVEHETRPNGWNSSFSNSGNTVYWNISESDMGFYQGVMDYIVVDDHIEITRFYPEYAGRYDLDFDIPRTIDGIPVTTINSYAFMDIGGKIIIPDTIITIQEHAFDNTNVKIYAEAESKPDGWHNNWKYYNATVQWNTIYFKMDAQGGTYAFPIVGTVSNLSYIGRGWIPHQTGYEFAGWYTNPECTDGNEWTFTQLPSEPDKQPTTTTTIYAKWDVVE